MPRTAPAPNIPAIPGMNPGVLIKAGGGAGGGAGAGRGKGKGGKKGANGQDGEDGAGDGKKGAGACGQGGNGACTNCASNLSAGDPVDVLTGKAFTEPKLDLHLPGAFDLRLLRSYSALRHQVDVGMGYGWTHSLAWTLTREHRNTVIRTGDGRRVELPKLDVGQQVQQGAWGLMRLENFYVLRPGNEFIHYFGLVDGAYRLQFVKCRNRGHLSLQYERGRLARVVDSVGRVVLFESDRDGRVETLSVPDSRGVRLVYARYAYDSEGNLVAASDADGNMTRYAYDDDHRLTRLEYPSGITFYFSYDAHGRCVETWGNYPNGVDPALASEAPTHLCDGSVAKGIYHCKLDYLGEEDNEYTEVVDSVRLRRFFGSTSGHISKAVDARGGVTTREFDEHGRVISVTDPNGATWQYQYDDLDEIVQETDPEGGCVTIRRDGGGREIGVIDAEGGQIDIHRDGHGEMQALRVQNGAIQHYVLGVYGRMVERVDERGARHTYEYDQHANLTAYVTPSGSRFEFSYDYWGRRLTAVDPLGRTTRWSYTEGGRIYAVDDELGRRTTFRYDAMGNLVEQVEADGSVTSWRYGGLNWLYSTRHPDGSEVISLYNREGWPLYVINPAGERHVFEYEASGLITRETDFAGRTTEYGYDGMGRLTWYDQGDGKFEIERNKIGKVVAETAPDDTRAEYSFNRRGELLSATRGDVEFRWERDAVGLVTAEEIVIDGALYRVNSERTAAGDRVRTLTSLGLDVSADIDREGRVAELRAPEGRIVSFERDPLGLPVRRTLSGGAAIVDRYDAGQRLIQRELVRPSAEVGWQERPEWATDSAPGHSKRYDYSPVDELVQVFSADGESVQLEYDVRRHLLRRERRQAQGAAATLEVFRADADGNYYEAGLNAVPRVYTAGDQLKRRGDFEYVYDARGCLVQKRRLGSAGETIDVTTFEWDGWRLLTAVVAPDGTRTEFKYDAFARRISKSTRKGEQVVDRHHYVWDLATMVHDVRLSAGNDPDVVATYLYQANDEEIPLAQTSHLPAQPGPERGWTYYVGDIKNMPESLVDGAGNVVGRYSHLAFGKAELAPGSTASTPFRAPGQQEDPETGLFYNRYRYYDPDLGRFISPDPIGLGGGLNTYAFGPNTIAWIDPMGWKHHCITVSNQDDEVDRTMSGYHDAPGALKSQPRAHTEQKFVHELLSNTPKKGARKGEKYTLLGQMPPCPRCHASMMRGAKETGANIDYKWKDKNGNVQTLSYEGGSGKPSSSGAQANSLRGSYATENDLHDNWKFKPNANPSDDTTNDYWGVNGKQGAEQAYFDMSSNKSANQNVHKPGSSTPYWSDKEIADHQADDDL